MKTILFIEDDPILGRVYESRLTAAGFEVARATDGEAGLRALQFSRPDLILLDMMLPRVSGLEVLRFIRSHPDSARTPVIVFSSSFEDDILKTVRELGVERVLSKSQFVPREVIAVINELLFGRDGSAADVNRAQVEKEESDREFARQLKEQLALCRHLINHAGRETDTESRLQLLDDLRTPVQWLTSLSSASNQKVPSYFCEALDALLGELCRRSDRLTDSALRTVIQSVDFLFEAFDFAGKIPLPDELTFRILAVDDDPISRRAIQAALRRIKQQATESENARGAIELCQRQSFDLIFLDVEMPEMSGFELCAQLRMLETTRRTPVVFITSHSDLQNRAQSSLSGGSDFIGKPFHFMELAVKSLLYLLRSKPK